jgi:cobalt/nickel transport system ATP-binding protein
MTAPALTCRAVTVRYEHHGTTILDEVSFEIAAGERVALVGLNGSGKTTLLMAAVGLIPHEGDIEICGTKVSAATLPKVRDQVGFLFNVPEDQLLFPRVIDDVAFALLRRGLPAAQAADKARAVLKLLELTHLAEHSLHHLSHGQKQRVALAGALVAEPPLLLLDEPSAGLDPPAKRGLADLLRQQPAAMLVATHDLAFARRFCDRFVMLAEGRVVADAAEVNRLVRGWDDL